MESATMNPPVIAENLIENVIFSVFVIDEIDVRRVSEESFQRRLADTRRRYDQAWVGGNARTVAKISYELDELELEAKENGFKF